MTVIELISALQLVPDKYVPVLMCSANGKLEILSVDLKTRETMSKEDPHRSAYKKWVELI